MKFMFSDKGFFMGVRNTSKNFGNSYIKVEEEEVKIKGDYEVGSLLYTRVVKDFTRCIKSEFDEQNKVDIRYASTGRGR